jgi:hypothetical protein
METATVGISAIASGGATPVSQMMKFTFTTAFGAVTALVGSALTVNVPGLKVGDVVTVICTSAPPAGMVIGNTRVSAADTLEIQFVTAVAIGITLPSLNFAGVALR